MGEPIWTGPAVAVVTLFDADDGLLAAQTGAHADAVLAVPAEAHGISTTRRLG
ncbi:hypothetical protein [Actinoplanes sp. NBRC 103695]|uniref:hypothetical protein n=1 Tax=Actinoplanes sp. NBRC 103695 TaxID=3032202 RepID=UPI0024A0EA5B|nr:hypothetical protein [Actinoplanes sp. NBRC 103695]GLY94949.1 hypothetical protein Acsp02_22040 [Actinoplanes sp. NBRC 103695]